MAKMTKIDMMTSIKDLLEHVEGADTTEMVAFLTNEIALNAKRSEVSRKRAAAKRAAEGPKEPKPRSEFMNYVIGLVGEDNVLAENLSADVAEKYPEQSLAQIRNALARGVKDGLLVKVDVLVSVEKDGVTKTTKRTAYHIA